MTVERTAVLKGAALLDEKTPDWITRIHRPIDTADNTCDVLAQVYKSLGSVSLFGQHLDDFDPLMIEFGMTAPWNDEREPWEAESRTLNLWWQEEVEKRR